MKRTFDVFPSGQWTLMSPRGPFETSTGLIVTGLVAMSATPKDLHNSVLLAAMFALSILAVRRASESAHVAEAAGVAGKGD